MSIQKANIRAPIVKVTASEKNTFVEPPAGPRIPASAIGPDGVVSPFGPFGARIRHVTLPTKQTEYGVQISL